MIYICLIAGLRRVYEGEDAEEWYWHHSVLDFDNFADWGASDVDVR